MKVYNTLTNKIEDFIPNDGMNVKMYTCGPTVYHYAHIGNLRTYIFEDVLEKTLNYLGYKVTRCMNITDVGHLSSDSDSGEDKMLSGAKREKKSVLEIAEYYTEKFKEDCNMLNIKWPEIVSKATDNIPEYIEMIKGLLDKGNAYIAGGNIYFDVTTSDNYHSLTNQNLEDLEVGVRDSVEEDTNKRNPADFVLWFTKSKFDDQELKWDSPWGIGYPGWHLECSAISLKYLGDKLDIHCGGVDNIFPHHTNEIAQSEAYLGHKWCNYWIHGEHLNDQSGKMSKSKGEFLTVSLLKEKGYDPLAYRFMCLQSHYRKVLVFTFESLDNVVVAFKKLKNKISNIDHDGELNEEQFNSWNNQFKDCLSDDLNTANAITVLYNLLKDKNINGKTKRTLIKHFDQVLGLNLLIEETKVNNDVHILEQIEKRNQAKKSKDFQLADSIRDELLEQGIKLLDTRDGTTYEIL